MGTQYHCGGGNNTKYMYMYMYMVYIEAKQDAGGMKLG